MSSRRYLNFDFSRWQLVQSLSQQFWVRWSKECLRTLQQDVQVEEAFFRSHGGNKGREPASFEEVLSKSPRATHMSRWAHKSSHSLNLKRLNQEIHRQDMHPPRRTRLLFCMNRPCTFQFTFPFSVKHLIFVVVFNFKYLKSISPTYVVRFRTVCPSGH